MHSQQAPSPRQTHAPSPQTHVAAAVRLPRDAGGMSWWEFAMPPVLVAVVAADRVSELEPSRWSAPGVHCLLGAADDRDAGALRAEVGGAPTRVRERVRSQRRAREWWHAALVAISGSWLDSATWGPGEATYLERRLYQRLRRELFGELTNRVSPPHAEPDAFRTAELDATVDALTSVVHLLGSAHITAVDRAQPPKAHRPAPMTWTQAAARVLGGAGRQGLPVRDIATRIHADGLRDPRETLTPEQTLHRELRQAARDPKATGIQRLEGSPVRYASVAGAPQDHLPRGASSR